MRGVVEQHWSLSVGQECFETFGIGEWEDIVFRRPEQQDGHCGQLWQTALNDLHISPAAVTLMERNRAWPGEHDVVGIRLVKHVMIGPRLLSTQAATTGDRRPVL